MRVRVLGGTGLHDVVCDVSEFALGRVDQVVPWSGGRVLNDDTTGDL